MNAVAFIGLGNMGLPMVANLVRAGHAVRAFDMNPAALAAAVDAGALAAGSVADAVAPADCVITALPAARHVRAVLSGPGGGFASARPDTLFIDCSTIDVETARALSAAAAAAGHALLDSPMSGGVGGATAGTLTFMVGGEPQAFARAEPVLRAMGRAVLHAGGPGAGAAAKICNNMMLAVQMIAVSEGFALAEKLGLDAQKLWDVASTATSRCWSLNDYCPAPGPVPSAPSNRDYAPGFSTELMLKDLRIAMETAQAAGAVTPMGAQATQLYAMMAASGMGGRDFSAMFRFLGGGAR